MVVLPKKKAETDFLQIRKKVDHPFVQLYNHQLTLFGPL